MAKAAANESKATTAGSVPSGEGGTSPLGISEDQARTILRTDLHNILRKVQAGKPLSEAQRRLLSTAGAGGSLSATNYVANLSELAKAIGVNRQTVAAWRKLPGNPGSQADGRYHVPDWITYKDARKGLDRDTDPETVTDLRKQLVQLQVRKFERNLRILDREYIATEEVERLGAQLGSAIRKIVTQLHLAAPSVVGVSVPEAEAILKEQEDSILAQLHGLTLAIETMKTPRAADFEGPVEEV